MIIENLVCISYILQWCTYVCLSSLDWRCSCLLLWHRSSERSAIDSSVSVATGSERRRGGMDSPASASRRRGLGLFTVPIHCSCFYACQVPMLTALRLAGFGVYRRRAPARHDGLADFDGYQRQVVARWSHFGLCSAATSVVYGDMW
jgi:hypothetical protein